MNIAPPQNPFLERAFTDKMQDLLLIHTVVLFRGQMDQLKQQIIDIKINCFACHTHLLHFFIEPLCIFPDLYLIILFDRGDQRIQPLFAQHNSALTDLHLLLIEIKRFLLPKGLQRFQHAG